MAKTNFVNGTIVTPTFLNAVQEHVHDGVDSDGHAPKVTLTGAADVTGLLPSANVDNDSSVSGSDLTAALNNLLFYSGTITEGNFDVVFPNTEFTTQQTVTIHYRKQVFGTVGKPAIVTMFIPALYATSNATTLNAAAATIPVAIRPTSDACIPAIMRDNGVFISGSFIIEASGVFVPCPLVTLNGDAYSKIYQLGSAWTNSGTKGFSPAVITYPIW